MVRSAAVPRVSNHDARRMQLTEMDYPARAARSLRLDMRVFDDFAPAGCLAL
jgi:hypothetical protein